MIFEAEGVGATQTAGSSNLREQLAFVHSLFNITDLKFEKSNFPERIHLAIVFKKRNEGQKGTGLHTSISTTRFGLILGLHSNCATIRSREGILALTHMQQRISHF